MRVNLFTTTYNNWFDLKSELVLDNIPYLFFETFYKQQIECKISNLAGQKLLPNFLIYQTKNNDLSSTKIRKETVKK